jgi:DNA-binding NarL/FixJ family response regulator
MASGQGTLTVGVVVVDDQLVFRQVAREVIALTPGFYMLGDATSGEQALTLVDEVRPDLVLLDVRMPGMDGIETASRLHAEHPDVVVVLISVDEASHMPRALASCGAADVLRKQDFGPSLLRKVWERYGPRTPGQA